MPSESDENKLSPLEQELASRVELEKLVADISLSFHVSNEADLSNAIASALDKIGHLVGADRCSFLWLDYDRNTASYHQEWCAEGIDSQIELLQEVPLNAFPWTAEMVLHHDVINHPDTSEMPPEAENEKQIFLQQGVKSILQVRVMGQQEKPIGLLSFDSIRSTRTWAEEDQYLLRVLSRILGGAFEQVRLINALSENESMKRALLEAIPDLIFIIDPEGCVRDMHVQPGRELAFPADKMIGTICWTFLPPESHEIIKAALKTAFAKGHSEPWEDKLILPSGTLAHYEGRFVRLSDDRMFTIIRNITSRIKSQEAIQRLSFQLTQAEENQRKRLAYRLHDGVSQDLAAAAIKLQACIADQAESPAPRLLEIDKLIQLAIRNTTDLTRSLSPPILFELGLVPALASLCTSMSDKSEFSISLEENTSKNGLGEMLSIHLYRIARELLLNAIKYSEGDTIKMKIEIDSEATTLSVSDNGKGLDPGIMEVENIESRSGFGLFSIRQRLLALNGSVEILNSGGTTVNIRIPLQADDVEDVS
jgi:signal transduction histidine kinase